MMKYWKKYKAVFISGIVAIICLAVMGACYDEWNQMWYDMGRNTYRLLHK